MSIGYRPKGSDGPLYHPERDYAYITPTLMRSAIERLDAQDLPDELKRWKQENNITEIETIAAAEALARAQRDFVNAADPVESFEQALLRRDFNDIRLPVRQFLFAAIGEVFCAAWFLAVREVSKIGTSPSAERQMAEFAAAVHKFAANVIGPAYRVDAETVQLRNDVLQTQVAFLLKERAALQKQISQLTTPPETPKPKPGNISGWLNIAESVLKLVGVTTRTGPK